MKQHFIFVFIVGIALCGSLTGYSQDSSANRVINQPARPDSNTSRVRTTATTMDIRDRLVQLALINPSAEIDDRNVAIAHYTLKNTKSNIINNIVLQGNLNEYSIQKGSNNSTLYPRYNIGASLPLGLFTTRSRDIKIARENLNIAHAQKSDHDRVLREAVLSKYEDYLMAVDLLNLQKQLVEDVFTNFQKVEKNFADAKVQSEEYTDAYRAYNTELAKQRRLERDLRVVVIELERYIGVKLEDVLNSYK